MMRDKKKCCIYYALNIQEQPCLGHQLRAGPEYLLPQSLLQIRLTNCSDLYLSLGFPGGTKGKEPPSNAGDLRDRSSIPGWCKIHWREDTATLLQYSCLGNPWTEEPQRATVRGDKELDTAEAT